MAGKVRTLHISRERLRRRSTRDKPTIPDWVTETGIRETQPGEPNSQPGSFSRRTLQQTGRAQMHGVWQGQSTRMMQSLRAKFQRPRVLSNDGSAARHNCLPVEICNCSRVTSVALVCQLLSSPLGNLSFQPAVSSRQANSGCYPQFTYLLIGKDCNLQIV